MRGVFIKKIVCVGMSLMFPLIISASSPDNIGVISGSFFENNVPCSLRINIHNAHTGLYFGKIVTNQEGHYRIINLPLGKYYLITHPSGVGVRMPLQWKTKNLVINADSPEYRVAAVDGFAVKIIYPQDGENIIVEEINEHNPIVFSWNPYPGPAEYQIEIYSTDKTQKYVSGKISESSFAFDGMFEDSSTLKKRLYRWKLTVFPENSEWTGTSKPHDVCVGDLGKIKIYRGKYIELEFPKWYEPTINKLDLLKVLDKCYLLQKKLAAGQVPTLGPLPGKKQTFIYDPKITFAHSGNPIHFGKTFINEGSFPFFIALHEMAHNFQLGGGVGFTHLLGNEYYDKTTINFGFSEGLATLAFLYIAENLTREDLTPRVFELLQKEKQKKSRDYSKALKLYEKNGADEERITPDIIDGICIRLGDQYGWEIFPVFFRIFLQNEITDQIYELAGDDNAKRTTILIAAFSVVSKDDLRKEFRLWDFPIDDEYYRKILPLVKEALLSS